MTSKKSDQSSPVTQATKLITSPFRRVVKIGGLVGKVGASMVGEKTIGVFRSNVSKEMHKVENLMRNANRIVKTLGTLKGGAMKVGQMLSLHEGLLPPEISQVLSALQNQAPSVSFDQLHDQIKLELKDNYALIKHIHPESYASASIGQVHMAELMDGRHVVIKVQYPNIDNVIRADLKNLKLLFKSLFSLVTQINLDPVWEELKERLLEELDYQKEAYYMQKMATLYQDDPEILIPKVIDSLTTPRVLTMELLKGISPRVACSSNYPQELKDQWGQILFNFILKGLIQFNIIHADPNLANFAFLEEGKVIVYDFGCMKSIPDYLVQGYIKLIQTTLNDQEENIPTILQDMGIYKVGNTPLPLEMTSPYYHMFKDIYRSSPPFTFGEDQNLYHRLFELAKINFYESKDVCFPQDIVFINRTMSGHLGNLRKLKATGPWREMIQNYL